MKLLSYIFFLSYAIVLMLLPNDTEKTIENLVIDVKNAEIGVTFSDKDYILIDGTETKLSSLEKKDNVCHKIELFLNKKITNKSLKIIGSNIKVSIFEISLENLIIDAKCGELEMTYSHIDWLFVTCISSLKPLILSGNNIKKCELYYQNLDYAYIGHNSFDKLLIESLYGDIKYEYNDFNYAYINKISGNFDGLLYGQNGYCFELNGTKRYVDFETFYYDNKYYYNNAEVYIYVKCFSINLRRYF